MTKVFDPADYSLETIVGASGLTLGQMVTMYRQAPKKGEQLRALCELSGMSEEQIKALLLANGVGPMEMPKKRKKVGAEPPPAGSSNAADLPADAKEAFARATKAIDDLAALLSKYVEAQDAALRKLQKIKELLDREGVHRDEP